MTAHRAFVQVPGRPVRYFAGALRRLAPGRDLGIVPLDMEPGLVTLAKIIGTLLFGMGVIPILFLMSGGDMTEPEDRLDSEHKG